MNKNILITGNSGGLGLAFTQHLLNQDYTVYGCSRRGCALQHPQLFDHPLDLADLSAVQAGLAELLGGVEYLKTVILNAGILGDIQTMPTIDMDNLKSLMDINVWSNKLALDWLLQNVPRIDQVIAISSGAAVNGHKGWGAYSLSKAALNMLTKLYASEYPCTHFTALAPGLVDTAMQDHLCNPQQVDAERFPSVQKLRAARGTDNMPTADQAAATILSLLPTLPDRTESGAFVDVRTL